VGKTVLALRAAHPSDPDAFPIDASRSLSLKGLCVRYGIPLGQGRRYAAERYQELLIVDLRNAPIKVFEQ
jgi:hypothetical protein